MPTRVPSKARATASSRGRRVAARPAKRPPTEAEKDQIIAACRRRLGRTWPVTVEIEGNQLAPPHSDAGGHLVALLEVFGTRSQAFLATNAGALETATRPSGTAREDGSSGLNAGLAMVQAIEPQNELEAALAIQMAATHALVAEMLGRAKQTDRTDHLQLYGNLAVKLQRTFTAQVEALARLRGKSQQSIRVEYVSVQPGAQAIVGDVHHHQTGGPGSRLENGVQSDAQCLQGPSDAPVASLSSPHPPRDRVPCAGHEKRPLPHARRHKSRRPKG
jgi:hypothetical protein